MTVGELDRAIHRARNLFDQWNDCTGVLSPASSYYFEMMACLEDAVHCGAQAATEDFKKLDGETDEMFNLARAGKRSKD